MTRQLINNVSLSTSLAWPGGQPGNRRGDKPSSAIDATDVIWDFFKAHPK